MKRILFILVLSVSMSACGSTQPNLRQQQAAELQNKISATRQEHFLVAKNYPQLGKLKIISFALPDRPEHFYVSIRRQPEADFPQRPAKEDDAMVIDIAGSLGAAKICPSRGGVASIKRIRAKTSFGLDLTGTRQKRIKLVAVDCKS